MVDNAPPTDGGIGQVNSSAPQQHPTLWQSIWWNPNPKQPPRLAERTATSSSAGAVALRVLQWIVAGVAAMVLASVSSDYPRTHLPGASPELFWTTVGMACACVLLHVPPVFFRLPRAGRVGAYALLVAFFFVANRETQVAVDAYAATPEGAQEARFNDKARRADAAEQVERAETERLLAESAETQKQLSDYMSKAERCFSWGHRLPALEDPVRESMENPSAFEHVKTELIVPDADRNNVTMTFRAENGFGAIRTVHVTAQLIAEDCTVHNIGEPTDD